MIIDKRDTKNLGQVFTPDFIVCKILDEVGYNNESILGKFILEPSCGNGAFLEEIVNRICKYSKLEDLQKNLECVFGWELDTDIYNECIERLNNQIQHYNIHVNWNIENTNSIFKKDIETRFDYIVGNPPYLLQKNLDKQTKDYISRNYTVCVGNYDIYFAFFELSYFLLSDSGKCSFITPTTFLYNDSGKYLRDFLESKKSLCKFIDYNDIMIFYPVSTYTSITIFTKAKNNSFVFENVNSEYNQYIDVYSELLTIDYKKLSEQRWNFKSNEKQVSFTNPLSKYCKIISAIVTGADSILILKISRMISKDLIEVTNKLDETFLIERGLLKKIVKISRERNVIGQKFEYTIFPYFISDNNFHIISEDVLKEKYPNGYQYLIKHKDLLERREYEKWFALTNSTKSIKSMLGEKIIFSPLMLTPKFFKRNDNLLYYSGFLLKTNSKYIDSVLKTLMNAENWNRISSTFNVVKGGWKRIKTSILLNEINLN